MFGFIKRLFGLRKEKESLSAKHLHDFFMDYQQRNHRIDYKLKPDLWKNKKKRNN